jgi:hypothetical protein
MANFNDQYLRGLKAKDKPFRIMDTGKGGVDGLGIQVTTGGRKNWFIRYRDQRNSKCSARCRRQRNHTSRHPQDRATSSPTCSSEGKPTGAATLYDFPIRAGSGLLTYP